METSAYTEERKDGDEICHGAAIGQFLPFPPNPGHTVRLRWVYQREGSNESNLPLFLSPCLE
jgi:hypothetical protein